MRTLAARVRLFLFITLARGKQRFTSLLFSAVTCLCQPVPGGTNFEPGGPFSFHPFLKEALILISPSVSVVPIIPCLTHSKALLAPRSHRPSLALLPTAAPLPLLP